MRIEETAVLVRQMQMGDEDAFDELFAAQAILPLRKILHRKHLFNVFCTFGTCRKRSGSAHGFSKR